MDLSNTYRELEAIASDHIRVRLHLTAFKSEAERLAFVQMISQSTIDDFYLITPKEKCSFLQMALENGLLSEQSPGSIDALIEQTLRALLADLDMDFLIQCQLDRNYSASLN